MDVDSLSSCSIEDLVQFSVAEGLATMGAGMAWLAAQGGGRTATVLAGVEVKSMKAPRWTEEEDAFLRRHWGWWSTEDLAETLGRSPNAVHLRAERGLALPMPSKRPGWLTGQQVGEVLGRDEHAIMHLARRGILPMVQLPGLRGIRIMRKVTLYRWAINPMHWPYFRPWERKVRDWRLARLLELKAERWGDEWWTIGQVARYYGVHHTDVNRVGIKLGKLPGMKYGNWWFLRSVAIGARLEFPRGSGNAKYPWPAAADEFMLRASREGMACQGIAARMKWPEKRVWYRLHCLRKDGYGQEF